MALVTVVAGLIEQGMVNYGKEVHKRRIVTAMQKEIKAEIRPRNKKSCMVLLSLILLYECLREVMDYFKNR